MSKGVPPSTTVHACRAIAADMDLSVDVVRAIVDAYTRKIVDCLKAEMPFMMAGLGKFYHQYGRVRAVGGSVRPKSFYEGKVSKTVVFKPSDTAKLQLNGWVHDLKIKTNLPKELARIAIRPDEIEKIRRRQVLDDQRQLGFRSELLFDEDELPEHDRAVMRDLGEAPTVDEIIRRIGANIDTD